MQVGFYNKNEKLNYKDYNYLGYQIIIYIQFDIQGHIAAYCQTERCLEHC